MRYSMKDNELFNMYYYPDKLGIQPSHGLRYVQYFEGFPDMGIKPKQHLLEKLPTNYEHNRQWKSILRKTMNNARLEELARESVFNDLPPTYEEEQMMYIITGDKLLLITGITDSESFSQYKLRRADSILETIEEDF